MFSSEKSARIRARVVARAEGVLVLGILGLSFLGFMGTVQAESMLNLGNAANLSASARLEFRVVVPRLLFLSVGTATAMADNTTVDQIAFNVPQNAVGNAVPVAASSGTGAYPVTARVVGLGSSVSLTATGSAGGLTDGTKSIPWSQIAASSSGTLPHPAIGDGGAGVATNLAAIAGVVDKTATWTFNYANTLPLASGSYAGQVIYTAALP